MQPISNLMFDLGGVILDIDRMRCVRAFETLGMTRANEFLGEYGQKGPFGALERGDISPAEFRAEVRRLIDGGESLDDATIDLALNEFLLDIPVHRLELLRRLRTHCRIYLLSNTNRIMWDSKIAECFRREGREREDYFDGMLTSFEARLLKPEPGIFQMAVERFGIDPTETLFLDDSQANIAAAEMCGFQGAVVAPRTEFANCLPYSLLK